MKAATYDAREGMKTVEEEEAYQSQLEAGEPMNSQMFYSQDQSQNPVIDFSGGDRRYNFQHASRDPSPPQQHPQEQQQQASHTH